MNHSELTRKGLAAAKARGSKIGNPRFLLRGDPEAARLGREAQRARSIERCAAVWPHVEAARRAGAASLREIARALEAAGVKTPIGGETWTATQVARVIARHKEMQPAS